MDEPKSSTEIETVELSSNDLSDSDMNIETDMLRYLFVGWWICTLLEKEEWFNKSDLIIKSQESTTSNTNGALSYP